MSNDIQFTDITREQFAKYVEIQDGGRTNMLDMPTVEWLSDFELDREMIKCIIRNYEALKGKYRA